jgi:tetratricopeptide (TPR) repeat protein
VSLLTALALAAGPGAEPGPVPDAELLRQAEAAFRRGAAQRSDADKARQDFAEAARGYERLRRRGADNADLYRNQGNAYLLAGQLPEAVLAYRRGLRCAPHDGVLRDNLDYARDQVHYGPENRGRPDDPIWPAWLPRLDRALFLLTAFLLYGLACFHATRALLTADGRHFSRAALLLALAVAAAGLWAYLTWRGWREAESPLVVIARDGVPLARGNGPSYPPNPQLPQLNRGMEARLLHRRGGWLQIELPGGAVGWVPQTAALVDEP